MDMRPQDKSDANEADIDGNTTLHVARILVIADDFGIRDLLSTYLKGNGFRIAFTSGGSEMRSLIQSEQVDLIILDVGISHDDALSLCRELRAGKHKARPLLLLTASDDDVDGIVGLELGADDYLAKPFSLRVLLARITALLRRSRI